RRAAWSHSSLFLPFVQSSLEHAAPLQEVGFGRGTNVGCDLEAHLATVSAPGRHKDRSMVRYSLRNPVEDELFTAVEAKGLDIVFVGEQERYQPDADQVRAMDALER